MILRHASDELYIEENNCGRVTAQYFLEVCLHIECYSSRQDKVSS